MSELTPELEIKLLNDIITRLRAQLAATQSDADVGRAILDVASRGESVHLSIVYDPIVFGDAGKWQVMNHMIGRQTIAHHGINLRFALRAAGLPPKEAAE